MATEPTVTVPPERRGYQSTPELITALGVFGTGTELPMLATEVTFTFGRDPLCDLRVVNNKHVSAQQARIDRLRPANRQPLHVTDISEHKNAIVVGGVAECEFDIGAGDSFSIGKVTYFALNEEMRLARSTAMDLMGAQNHEDIDRLLIGAVREQHVLILGEKGSDQLRLAELIHSISHRRHRRFHAISADETLDETIKQRVLDAAYGTIFVPVFQHGKMDAPLASALLKPSAEVRLVLAGLTRDKITASFPEATLGDTQLINVRPLRERSDDVPSLFDKWFVKNRTEARFALLRPEIRAALASYRWPKNIEELRKMADLISTLAHYPNKYQAEKHSGISSSTLRRWQSAIRLEKLTFPIMIK